MKRETRDELHKIAVAARNAYISQAKRDVMTIAANVNSGDMSLKEAYEKMGFCLSVLEKLNADVDRLAPQFEGTDDE